MNPFAIAALYATWGLFQRLWSNDLPNIRRQADRV